MVYVERPKLHNQGKGETSMRKLLSAAVHASAQALETSVNLLESATGLDIDGDGDVGLAGSGNTPRKDRPPDVEPGAPASSARESKSSGLSGLMLSKDPNKQPTAKQLREHPWVNGCVRE